ncbi:MAG TPA: ribonuclease III [Sneathiellales bacterium]|nr:ribonuclease III [Sneathiellales bacterium]
MKRRNLDKLSDVLEHQFERTELLERALTHPSVEENEDYERLEFLGDRVLGLVIADCLLELYPLEDEGDLAARYNELVRQERLAEVAELLDLGRFMRIGKGEDKSLKSQPALLANVCEAIIAALYLDGGLEAARSLIRTHWATSIAAQIAPPKDSKSELQEWAMSQGFALPDYEEVARAGPDHAPVFTMEVRVEGQVPASGTGSSKKAAESEAASALLQQLSDLE